MRIGVFGDAHIPDRASEIPENIKSELYSCDFIICTGDLTGGEVAKFAESSGKPHKIVRGNMDHLDFPKVESIDIEEKRIVVVHGDEVVPRGDKAQLFEIAKRYDADVLVYGHTHIQDVWTRDGIMFVNPGSATRSRDDKKPHCAVIEIKNNAVSVKKA